MKYLLYFLSVLSPSVFYVSCDEPIKAENKILTVAKISTKSVGQKNGAKKVTWFYRGKQYFDTRSFDSRRFSYGDKFLLYIDKNNPNNNEFPRPIVKFYDSTSLSKSLEYPFKLQKQDLQKLDSVE